MDVDATVDVLVVGAGLAGLTAAYRLDRAGVDVVVMEAADQAGGRTRSAVGGGQVVDFGAEWLGPGHTHLNELIRELRDVELEPARMLGRPILWRGESVNRIGRSLPLGQELLFAKLLWRLRWLARQVDPHHPWESPRATELDGVSFGAWLEANGGDGDAYRYLSALVGMLTGTPIQRLSLLHVLWWIARGGGPLALLHTTFAHRVRGGAQSIATSMAGHLGGRVRLSCPVTRVAQDATTARVWTSNGDSYRTGRVIVTGSLNAKIAIDHDPPLPESLRALGALQITPGVKVTGILPPEHRPRHTAALGGGPVGGAWRTGQRITGFAQPGCDEATDEELLSDLAACFATAATALRHPAVFRWSEQPAIGGCDIGFAPGQLTALGPHLLTSHGLVDFAGAERSSWPNNMEGAVESGIRATHDAMSALSVA